MSEDIDFLQKEDAAYGIHRDYTPVVVSLRYCDLESRTWPINTSLVPRLLVA